MVALVALMGGVEVASAGVLDPVTENPSPAVTPPPVEDVVPDAEEAVPDAEEAVTDAVGQTTEPVAEVTETAGQATKQATETAGQAKQAVEQVVRDTPVGNVLAEAEQIVAPVVEKPVPSLPATGQPQAARSSGAASVSGGGSTPSDRSPGAAEATPATPLSTGLGLDPASLTSPIRQNDAFASGPTRLSPQQLWSPPAARATGDQAASASPVDDSSGFPWPFSPSFPVDTAAVAAFAAGAAGGALTVALLAAFMFMAPSAGRWLRPGPTLGWPPPAVPSPERPG